MMKVLLGFFLPIVKREWREIRAYGQSAKPKEALKFSSLSMVKDDKIKKYSLSKYQIKISVYNEGKGVAIKSLVKTSEGSMVLLQNTI